MIYWLTGRESAVMTGITRRVRGVVVHARRRNEPAYVMTGVTRAIRRNMVDRPPASDNTIVAKGAGPRRAFKYFLDMAKLAIDLTMLTL